MNKNFDKILFRVIFLSIMFIYFSLQVSAQIEPNILKAAYIERITRFIDMGDTAIADTIVFGIAYDRNFEATAEEIFKTQHIKGLPVKTIRVSDENTLKICQLCYIGNTDSITVSRMIETANQNGILLISHDDRYGQMGVHINFYIEDDKLKFEINKTTIQKAGFTISHLLMKNARVIYSGQ